MGKYTQDAAKLLELDFTPTAENVHLIDMCGPGYAIPSPEGNAAENEGLFLDPVYTGKAWTKFLMLVKEGYFDGQEHIAFVHTGGAAALFAMDLG